MKTFLVNQVNIAVSTVVTTCAIVVVLRLMGVIA
jgi:hypothetical protein